MKYISIITALLLSINVHSIFGNHMENINNEDNSVIIEWANDKSGRCQAYSIYEDDVLIKSNIPILNNKINIDDLHHKHGKLTLKCDSFVKQKREAKGDEAKALSSEESSVEESDTDDDSIINAIDNFFFPSDFNEEEDKESSDITEKVYKLKDNVKNPDNDSETKSDSNINNKDGMNNNNDKENSDKNRNDKKDNDDVKNNNNDTKTEDANSSKDIDDNKNGKGNDDKPSKEEDTEDNKPVHLGVGVTLSFLLTGGLFLSVMKIRKMSDLQLEINAQEMSADSVYVPSPRISSSGSMSLSMSSLELGNINSLQENSFGSTLNSFVV